MTGEGNEQRRVPRKLSKRPRYSHRLPSAHIPERLRGEEDAQEDVTAPAAGAPSPAQYMNQSVFSMIAAAGSRTDFNARFDDSSESEEDQIPEDEEEDDNDHMRQSQILPRGPETNTQPLIEPRKGSNKLKEEDKQSKPDLPDRKILSSFARRRPKEPSSSSSTPAALNSTIPLPSEGNRSLGTFTPRDAPMLTRMVEARAEFNNAEDGKVDNIRDRADSSPATLLATRLMEIFGFAHPETVIAEYPCWLLQSVLLQGYMYITRRHICFYAYLPKKENLVAKTGYLYKKGKRNPRYSRHWFSLKGDVLTYYNNPKDLYFPHGNIDLRYGISAASNIEKDYGKDSKDFAVVTDHRTYHFQADSSASAKEWVKQLQKVIFRSHNDGDSVKIIVPTENVIDIEESPVVEFAETFKIRVLESVETFAIDEVSTSVRQEAKDH